MTAVRSFNVRVRFRREETQVPATLLFGEPAYVHGLQEFYIGGPDGVPVKLNSPAEPGPQGLTGPQGLKGDTGLTGAAGPQGLKGDTGLTGAAGPQGLKGDTGLTGAAGSQGLKGDTGLTGAVGPQGLKGDTGLTGAAGPQGDTGPQGPQGLTGPTTLYTGVAPPTDATKVFWAQVDVAGVLLDLWQKSPTGIWVSAQTFLVSSFVADVTGNAFTSNQNPCPGAQIFIERFSARALLVDAMTATNLIDFKLSLINTSQVETNFFFVRSQGPAAANSMINLSEPVNQVVTANNSLGLWFRSLRTGSMKMKFLTMSATLRKVYAP
jgi:hypothetical protein